ncbi:MAG: hypothetical protein ACRC8K_18990, partial [Waterburya sp.]
MKLIKKMTVCGLVASLTTIFSQQLTLAEIITLGKASGGQIVKLDTQSISRNGNNGSFWAGFSYYLGQRLIPAEAHCVGEGSWYSDGSRHIPQSQATRNMLNIVCSGRHVDGVHQEEGYGYSLVFDPPSNVRATPSGQVICSISEMIVIS